MHGFKLLVHFASSSIPGRKFWHTRFLDCVLTFEFRGLINAFGAFQTYYMTDLLASESPSNIAWIGSIQSTLILFVGSVIGPIFDAGHFKFLVRTGAFCLVLGLFMTSLCKELWQFILAQGILAGVGGGMLYLPSIAIIPQYFSTRRSLATGFASVGSSSGLSALDKFSLMMNDGLTNSQVASSIPSSSTDYNLELGFHGQLESLHFYALRLLFFQSLS